LSLRSELQERLHEFAAFTQGQPSEIAVLADEKVNNKIVDVRCFATKVLEQIEIRSA